MSDKKISELSSAAAITWSELVPIVQGGVTVRTTAQDIADLAGGGGGSSAIFPNGFNIVTESRMLTSDDIGKLLVVQPAEGETSISLGTPSTAPFLPIGQIGVFNTSTEIEVAVFYDNDDVILAPREIVILSSLSDTEAATALLSGFTFHDGYAKTFNKYLLDIGAKVPFTGDATLVAGTVTVADARIRTGAKIFVFVDTPDGTQGFLSAPATSIVDET